MLVKLGEELGKMFLGAVSGGSLTLGLGVDVLWQERFVGHAGGVQAVVSLEECAGGRCPSASPLRAAPVGAYAASSACDCRLPPCVQNQVLCVSQ